jgi:hypothetical protein
MWCHTDGVSHPEPPVAETLVFLDRKEQGRLPVRNLSGGLVAQIATSWTGVSFTAVDDTARPLCAGSARAFGLSRRWSATTPAGVGLLAITNSVWRSRAQLTLASGETFVLRGSTWRRDFVVTDTAGATVLSVTPRAPALSLRPYEFAVQPNARRFNLAEIVALVQIWRMVRKNDDTAAAAGAVAAGVAATSA